MYNIYKKTQRRFFLLWGTGFLLYGLNVLIRTGFIFYGVQSQNAEVLSYMILVAGFTLIITGIGDLINKTRLLLLSALTVPFILLVLYITTKPILLGQVVALSPFLFIGLSLLVIRINYSAQLDLFVVGWAVIALANIGYSFSFISPFYVEVYVIFGKVILFVGVLYPKFSYLVDDLRMFLISGVPTQYFENSMDRFVLLNSTSGKRSVEIQWIIDRLKENSVKDVKTILVSTYDLIAPSDLKMMGVDEESLYLIRMIQGGKSAFDIFTDKVLIINDDINDLDILFSDIINFSNERKIHCQIILYSLSSLIHTHGWKRVYTFLISKITYLKNSNVYLNALYYPKTHDNQSDIAKFELLADSVVEI